MTRRIFAVGFGIIVLVVFGYLMQFLSKEGGIMEYTEFSRTGYDQLKTLFLLISRLAMFLFAAFALIAWGFGQTVWAQWFIVALVVATFLNIIGMIVISVAPN